MLPSTGYLSLSLVSRSQTYTHAAHVRLKADAQPGSCVACLAQSASSGVMLAAEFRQSLHVGSVPDGWQSGPHVESCGTHYLLSLRLTPAQRQRMARSPQFVVRHPSMMRACDGAGYEDAAQEDPYLAWGAESRDRRG